MESQKTVWCLEGYKDGSDLIYIFKSLTYTITFYRIAQITSIKGRF